MTKLAPLLLLAAAPLARALDLPAAAAAPVAFAASPPPAAGEAPSGPLGGELPTGEGKDDNAFFTPPPKWAPAEGGAPGGSLNFLAGGGAPDGGTWRLPVTGYVTSPYGKRRLLPIYRIRYAKARNKKGKIFTRRRKVRVGRRLHIHKGIDLKALKGDPIHAVAAGVVAFAGRAHGYGNCVYIDHPDGLQTRYAHASRVLVSTGDPIGPGDVIALAGSTGRSTGPHLHFEVRREGEAVNPLPYLEAARVQEEAVGEDGDPETGDGGDESGGE